MIFPKIFADLGHLNASPPNQCKALKVSKEHGNVFLKKGAACRYYTQ